MQYVQSVSECCTWCCCSLLLACMVFFHHDALLSAGTGTRAKYHVSHYSVCNTLYLCIYRVLQLYGLQTERLKSNRMPGEQGFCCLSSVAGICCSAVPQCRAAQAPVWQCSLVQALMVEVDVHHALSLPDSCSSTHGICVDAGWVLLRNSIVCILSILTMMTC